MSDLHGSLGSSEPFPWGVVNWPELLPSKVTGELRSLQADGTRGFVNHRVQGWQLINQLNVIDSLCLIKCSAFMNNPIV